MREIVTSARFEKRLVTFSKHHPELQAETEKIIQILALQSILPTSLRAHPLKGTLKGCISVHVSYSYRLIFMRNNKKVSLIDIGNHDELYR
jgi:addiction module RelE/StbE family toxin